MNKKEVNEIKKQFTMEKCTITRICGCYVDSEKKKKTELAQVFLTLSEEEIFKYLTLFQKTLSGSLGKNLMNMEFPNAQEKQGGTQDFLLRLKNSKLQDNKLVEEFYDKVIAAYDEPENYLIILISAAYDVPGKTADGMENEDASDYVYEHILCSICPVQLTEAGLAYHTDKNSIGSRIRDWVVGMPAHGFLFPAFNDRNADIHSLLYYTKNSEQIQENMITQVLGCQIPLSYKQQQETFQKIVQDTLGEDCDFETLKAIHENLNDYCADNKDAAEPPELDKAGMRKLLEDSGVKSEIIGNMDEAFDQLTNDGKVPKFAAETIAHTKGFDIAMPDVVVKAKPEYTDLLEIKQINGVPHLIIRLNGAVEVNGIAIQLETGKSR